MDVLCTSFEILWFDQEKFVFGSLYPPKSILYVPLERISKWFLATIWVRQTKTLSSTKMITCSCNMRYLKIQKKDFNVFVNCASPWPSLFVLCSVQGEIRVFVFTVIRFYPGPHKSFCTCNKLKYKLSPKASWNLPSSPKIDTAVVIFFTGKTKLR